MSVEPGPLLLAAHSARAMAASAARGGYRVTLFDAFGDQDAAALGTWVPVRGERSLIDGQRLLHGLRRVRADVQPAGLIYGAGFEGRSGLLERVAGLVDLLGNPPELIERLGEPKRWFGLLDAMGIAHPEVRYEPPADPAHWLAKCAASSGGMAVCRLRRGRMPPARAGSYYQRYVAGNVLSALFLANGRQHRLIGFNRLLIDDSDPVRPFRYAGAINRARVPAAAADRVRGHLAVLTTALGLRGLNSLDFILNRGSVLVLELNSRPPATFELYEDQTARGWIHHHVRACHGDLPEPASQRGILRPVFGHRVVYAPAPIRMPGRFDWPDWTRDRPVPASRIGTGEPLCSVVARAARAEQVGLLLAQRRRTLLGQLRNQVAR